MLYKVEVIRTIPIYPCLAIIISCPILKLVCLKLVSANGTVRKPDMYQFTD